MNLSLLHENFIRNSFPTALGKLPINLKKIERPVIPVDKWEIKGEPKFLTKIFRFQSISARNEFLKFLLKYEEETNHGSSLMIRDEIVKISLRTQNIDEITSLDKEYASFADETFKDIVMYSGFPKGDLKHEYSSTKRNDK
jgi:pterin-4a-carbinolamine dehydratase